jgi:hypothetical protein
MFIEAIALIFRACEGHVSACGGRESACRVPKSTLLEGSICLWSPKCVRRCCASAYKNCESDIEVLRELAEIVMVLLEAARVHLEAVRV